MTSIPKVRNVPSKNRSSKNIWPEKKENCQRWFIQGSNFNVSFVLKMLDPHYIEIIPLSSYQQDRHTLPWFRHYETPVSFYPSLKSSFSFKECWRLEDRAWQKTPQFKVFKFQKHHPISRKKEGAGQIVGWAQTFSLKIYGSPAIATDIKIYWTN